MSSVLFTSVTKVRLFRIFPRRQIYVLGIESSCDDTAAAVVNNCRNILGEGHFSQAKVHMQTGGIIPALAHELHRDFLKTVVDTTMKQSLITVKDLNAVAVTIKPGLIMSLNAGLEFAKDLCALYSKPLIPIHHMEAHALTARLVEDVKFPFLVLLISGGHCILGLAKSVNKFYTLGSAPDKAPGSILDRIARRAKMRNLHKFKGLVGGVAVESAALEGDPTVFHFNTHTMQRRGRSCDFAFDGMEGAAIRHIVVEEEKHNVGPDGVIPSINDLCAGVLLSVTRHLCQQLEMGFHYIRKKQLLQESEKCLVLSGGVACNKIIQAAVKELCNKYEYKFVVPPSKLCTDNGVMIAWNGIEILQENLPVVEPDDLSSVTALSRCPFGEDLSNDVKEIGRQMSFKFTEWKDFSFMRDRSAERNVST